MKKFLMKMLWFFVLVFSAILVSIIYFLAFVAKVVDKSSKRKKHNPTLEEITSGEKLPFTDEYFIPSEKPHK